MTYKVFGGMLNPAQSNQHVAFWLYNHDTVIMWVNCQLRTGDFVGAMFCSVCAPSSANSIFGLYRQYLLEFKILHYLHAIIL